jgi:hypothetical protein
VPRGDPVNGVGVGRDGDAVPGQLVPESYRPRASGRRGFGQRREALLELLRPGNEGIPDIPVVTAVERREDLAAAGVLDDQSLAPAGHAAGDRVERADTTGGQAETGCEALGGGDADPQAGKRAGPEADGDQVDPGPAPGGVGRSLDLGQQRGRVAWAPARRQPQQRLVQRLAVAPGAGGRVRGRGIEADDEQSAASSP